MRYLLCCFAVVSCGPGFESTSMITDAASEPAPEAGSDAGSGADSEGVLDASLEAPLEAAADSSLKEACVPQTPTGTECATYNCGRVDLGCGTGVDCGPPYTRQYSYDYPFMDSFGGQCPAAQPYAWACYVVPGGPPPRSNCSRFGQSSTWCCSDSK